MLQRDALRRRRRCRSAAWPRPRIGGVGAAIAEWASDYGSNLTALLRFGTQDVFLHEAGGTDYARTRHGLSVEPIVEAITREINNQKRSVG